MSNKVHPNNDANEEEQQHVNLEHDNAAYISNGDYPQNDDVKKAEESSYDIEINETKDGDETKVLAEKPYAGMGKDDLLRFSETPFWNTFRLLSLLLFWLVWLALVGSVIGLTIAAPRCGKRPTPEWWQHATFYKIYVRSFYDSDTDGIGDLNGVRQKLDYIKDMNVDAIVLSSIFMSDKEIDSDHGYEVIDYMDINDDYGTLSDLRLLIETARRNYSISVFLDFVPNHTSKKHPWFVNSSSSRDYSNEFWSYYVWADCFNDTNNQLVPPNNWLSVYNGSAWTYDVNRDQCYLHQFFDTQPELNLRSSAVQAEFERILKYWLEVGVDGFMISSSVYLYESVDLRNEPTACNDRDNYDCLRHIYTTSQPEVYHDIKHWRRIVDQFNINSNDSRIRALLTDGDVITRQNALNYYGSRGDGAHLPANYILAYADPESKCDSHYNYYVDDNSDALSGRNMLSGPQRSVHREWPSGDCVMNDVRDFLSNMPDNTTACWLISDMERSRPSSSIGDEYIDAMHMIALTLPGTALLYYGNEISMTDHNSIRRSVQQDVDPRRLSRDQYRTPMQWDNSTNANFTSGTEPWLSVNPNYININVQAEESRNQSHLKLLRSLTELKSKHESIQYGQIHYLHRNDNHDLVAYVREWEGFDRLLVVVNLSKEIVTKLDLTTSKSTISIPSKADRVLQTVTMKDEETKVLTDVELKPGEGFIAKWAYSRPN